MNDREVAERLIAWLRADLACPELDYREQPERFGWGVDATLYAFSLRGAPDSHQGRLVLRLFPTDILPERARREAGVQRAVSRLGYGAPNALQCGRLGSDPPRCFFIMERLPGRSFIGVMMLACAAAFVVTLFGLFASWLVVLALYLTVMLRWLRRLHALPVDRLAAILAERGLQIQELQTIGRLADLEQRIGRLGAQGLQPGVVWLREHLPPSDSEVLCHGDFWPGNLIFGKSGISGVIDWGDAALAPREYDLAWPNVAFYSGLPVSGPAWFAGPASDVSRGIVWAVLGTYRLCYGALRRLDPGLMRYFTAFHCLRALVFAAERRRLLASDPRAFPTPHPWTQPRVIQLLERRFRRISGVQIGI